MIETFNISKQFGNFLAVDNFSINVPQKTILGLLGANGAGKSTIMKILTGYIAPTSGEAYICGNNIFSEDLSAKECLGYLPESVALYEDMKVYEFLSYISILKKADKVKDEIERVSWECRLDEVIFKKIKKLSKGYKQRTAIAQAIIGNPPVLILDEPTSSLDPVQVKETRNLIKKLGETKSILISTHILSEVEQICDQVAIIKKGKLLYHGVLEELLIKNEILIEILDNNINSFSKEIEALSEIDSVKILSEKSILIKTSCNFDIREDIFDFISDKKYKIIKMDYAKNKLEQIYINLTSSEIIV